MKHMILKATQREGTSRGDLRKLRRSGQIPGIVYGKSEQETLRITVNGQALQTLLRTNPRAVLELQIAGYGKRHVLIADTQRDAMTQEVLHIDFHTIKMDQVIRTSVRIEVSGKSAGEQEGGVLQLVLHELEVECLPGNLPEFVTLEVDDLQMGETLTAADLKLPEGVSMTTDPDAVIATVLAPQKESPEVDADPADGAAAEVREKQLDPAMTAGKDV